MNAGKRKREIKENGDVREGIDRQRLYRVGMNNSAAVLSSSRHNFSQSAWVRVSPEESLPYLNKNTPSASLATPRAKAD